MQFLLTSSPSISSSSRRRPRSTPSRKAKVKDQKDRKAKEHKGPHHFRMQKVSRKARARPSQKVKVSGPLGHGKTSSICGKSGHTSNQCWWNGEEDGWSSQGSVQQLKGSSGSQYSKEVYNIHQYPQDQPIQTLPPDQLRGLRDLRLQAQQQYQNLSQASTQCGSIATVLSSSDQVGGFSGQRLNINSLSDSCDLDSGIMGQEICASFPYSIGSDLPVTSRNHGPWAALIDSGAVTSVAPSSFAPHVPITPHLTLVNWSMWMVERSRSKVRRRSRMSLIRL